MFVQSLQYKKIIDERHPWVIPCVAWLVWVLIGTLFYSNQHNIGWQKGFYMSINVGYSIGWGFPVEANDGAKIFSVFYVLAGASAVAAALGYFAQSMIDSSKEWYVEALDHERVETSTSPITRVIAWIKRNDSAVKVICLWLLWILALIIFAVLDIENWSFADALYFSVTSLSTGGLWAIPSDSPDWYFGFVGLVAATGVPLMGLAMSHLSSFLINTGDPNQAEKAIKAKVTKQELKMMQRFDLDDGDGEISKAEYILLCAVRLGALSPKLIKSIEKRFKELDTDNSNSLSYREILETDANDTDGEEEDFEFQTAAQARAAFTVKSPQTATINAGGRKNDAKKYTKVKSEHTGLDIESIYPTMDDDISGTPGGVEMK